MVNVYNIKSKFNPLFVGRYSMEPEDDFSTDVLEEFVKKYQAGESYEITKSLLKILFYLIFFLLLL